MDGFIYMIIIAGLGLPFIAVCGFIESIWSD